MYTNIDSKIIIKYLISLKEKSGLTYEAIAEASGIPESTIKKLFSGKVENPGLDTILPIMNVLGGSFEEITGKSKDEVKEFSISSIKEMYEFQLAEQRNTEETRIMNIRADHEQHRNDVITNYERLLSEKENQNKIFKKLAIMGLIFGCIGLSILIGILIFEVMHPNLGWIRF